MTYDDSTDTDTDHVVRRVTYWSRKMTVEERAAAVVAALREAGVDEWEMLHVLTGLSDEGHERAVMQEAIDLVVLPPRERWSVAELESEHAGEQEPG
jgi:nucleotide-binding universal stress UspA family protein